MKPTYEELETQVQELQAHVDQFNALKAQWQADDLSGYNRDSDEAMGKNLSVYSNKVLGNKND